MTILCESRTLIVSLTVDSVQSARTIASVSPGSQPEALTAVTMTFATVVSSATFVGDRP